MARSRVYTTINLAGLVLGLTASFILLIFAINENGHNSSYSNAHRLFRVIQHGKNNLRVPTGTYTIKGALTDQFRDIEQAGRTVNLNYLIGAVSVKNKTVYQNTPDFFCGDRELVDLLSLRIIRGSRRFLLTRPDYIIISAGSARKFFGNDSPEIGRAHV